MILRTFNCTIVNQIKSSEKLVVKLKIRNLQLLQMKTIFKLFFGRVPLFSRGNKMRSFARGFMYQNPGCLETSLVDFTSPVNHCLCLSGKRLFICTIKEQGYPIFPATRGRFTKSCNTLPSTARRSHFLVEAVSPYYLQMIFLSNLNLEATKAKSLCFRNPRETAV